MHNRETLTKLIVFFCCLALLSFGLCAASPMNATGSQLTFMKIEVWTCPLSILAVIILSIHRSNTPPTEED